MGGWGALSLLGALFGEGCVCIVQADEGASMLSAFL